MNLRSLFGFSLLTACSAPGTSMGPDVFDSGASRLEASVDVSVNVAVDVPGVDAVVEDRYVSIDIGGDRGIMGTDSIDVGLRDSGDRDVGDVSIEDRMTVDVVLPPSRAARDLGVSLPCQPTEMEFFSDAGEYLLTLCGGRRFTQVMSPLGTPRIIARTELPTSEEALADISSTTDFSAVILGAGSVYQIDTDSSGTNVRSTFPAGHALSGNGVFVVIGSQRKFYAATLFSDAAYMGGEILVYNVSSSGVLTPRPSALPDGGVTHSHVAVSGRPISMGVSPTSVVSEIVILTTDVTPSLIRVNPLSDTNIGGRRLPAEIRPIDQSELQMTSDGRYVVFGNEDGRLVVVDMTAPLSTASRGVTFLAIPTTAQITDVRVVNTDAYVSTSSGTVYKISVPEGVVEDIITAGSASITAAEIAGSTIIVTSEGRLYAASL